MTEEDFETETPEQHDAISFHNSILALGAACKAVNIRCYIGVTDGVSIVATSTDSGAQCICNHTIPWRALHEASFDAQWNVDLCMKRLREMMDDRDDRDA